jgi:hypothetical protein
MCSFGMSILSGIVSGLLVLIFWSLIAAAAARRRASVFVGTYAMHEQFSETPSGGTVRIEFQPSSRLSRLRLLIDPTQKLEVTAEHGTGQNSGTEDWMGEVDVGISGSANGFYRYRKNQENGTLLLRLRDNRGNELIENGIPHREGQPFTKILKRKRKDS